MQYAEFQAKGHLSAAMSIYPIVRGTISALMLKEGYDAETSTWVSAGLATIPYLAIMNALHRKSILPKKWKEKIERNVRPHYDSAYVLAAEISRAIPFR